MVKICENISDLIGATPLLDLTRYCRHHNVPARLVAKLEMLNPTGSIKDRAAKAMLDDAQNLGLINDQTVIVEPTSGNTGIGLAALAAVRGNRIILTMPDTMSVERRKLLAAYGAELILTDGKHGMKGAIEKANELVRCLPNSFMPSQFLNPSNPTIHRNTTGPEIWKDTEGKVDLLVAGVGTGGTLSGTGEYLKSQNKNIRVVAVEPKDSPVLSGGSPGAHAIQGIGAGFIPETLNKDIYDSVMTVSADDAITSARSLAKIEGVLVGISSGAALWAATEVAHKKENWGKMIVVILPDTGERYLSSPLFEDI